MANGRESPIKQNGAQILKIVIVILRITSLMMNDEAICFIIIQYRSRSLTCICLMSFFLAASSITDVSHERGNINVHLLYTLYIYIKCIYTSSLDLDYHFGVVFSHYLIFCCIDIWLPSIEIGKDYKSVDIIPTCIAS